MASTIVKGLRFETSKFMNHIPDDHFLKPQWIGMTQVRCVNEKTFGRIAAATGEELEALLKTLKQYTPRALQREPDKVNPR